MTILQFDGPILRNSLGNVFAWLPDWKIGLVFLAVGIVLTLPGAVRGILKPRETKPSSGLLTASLLLLGSFMVSYRLVDEVAVNLEHSYNFFHHGLFSMSPAGMVDGSVELFFYFLHVPFAANLKLLFLGNFLICLFVSWLHLLLLKRFFFQANTLVNRLLLSAFAVSLPFIGVIASGFGNSLVSLLFLAAAGSYMNGRKNRSLALAAVLPLVRPDALLVAMGHVLVHLVHARQKRLLKAGEAVLWLCAPVVGLIGYLGIFKVLYGHFVPTPILFKAVKPSMMAMFSAPHFFRSIAAEIFQPVYAVTLGSFAAYLFYCRKKQTPLPENVKILFYYLFFLAPVYLFYHFSDSVISLMTLDTAARYWICALLIMIVSGLYVLSLWNNRTASLVVFIVFCGAMFFTVREMRVVAGRHLFFRKDTAIAGSFADRVFPAGFRLSAIEMNTFGLASERPVIDLHGYSNREIARSSVCNHYFVRSNPEIFLRDKPEIYWVHWVSQVPDFGFMNAEEILLWDIFGRDGAYAVGDMVKVAGEYDFVILKDGDFKTGFLVRGDKTPELEQSLLSKGFSKKASRPLANSFTAEYSRKPLIQHACG